MSENEEEKQCSGDVGVELEPGKREAVVISIQDQSRLSSVKQCDTLMSLLLSLQVFV